VTSTSGMTPDDLAAAGRALYGERWQTSLAQDLHISDRTIRRWLAGASPIPEHVESEVRAVLMQRFNEIGGMIAYDITPRDRTIFHQRSAATFRFDEAGNLTPLMPWLVAPEKRLLIEEGAKEKLRQHQKHNARAGLAAEVGTLHGFLRGSVVIPPEVDLTAPVTDEAFAAEEGEVHR
jgi:hypothetical protein